MKKITFFLFLFFCIKTVVFAETADQILAKAYKNIDKMTTFTLTSDVQNTDTNLISKKADIKTFKKHIVLKTKKKMKTTLLLVQTQDKETVVKNTNNSIVENDENRAILQPTCLFDIEKYLTDFNISVKAKDERIKLGKEEIIATHKSQSGAYPQIRIVVKDNKIISIKFFDILGKKYYEILVKRYEKINGIEMPCEIREALVAEKNKIEYKIVYSGIELNRKIVDSEFETTK